MSDLKDTYYSAVGDEIVYVPTVGSLSQHLGPPAEYITGYEFVENLDGGAQGKIKKYKRPSGEVAIKFMDKKVTERKAFDREVYILIEMTKLDTICKELILKYYNSGETEDYYYIIMEYVPGFTLAKLINDRWYGFTSDDILFIMKEISRALQCFHSIGYIHRDIKPENIMYIPGSFEFKIKLIDFGFSCANLFNPKEEFLDCSKNYGGTPLYIAPEIIKRTLVPSQYEKMDIFSLGVLFYYMATGERLFDGLNKFQLYDSIKKNLHRDVSTGSADLDSLIKTMINPNPFQRPSATTVMYTLSSIKNPNFKIIPL